MEVGVHMLSQCTLLSAGTTVNKTTPSLVKYLQMFESDMLGGGLSTAYCWPFPFAYNTACSSILPPVHVWLLLLPSPSNFA